jgi:prepilin-type N-terminal cleavage/methylation domain-containing protein
MNRIRRLLDRFTAESSGMTLVEVIVAIAIMGIVATAAIGLAVSSTVGSVSQQRRAIAVTVANAAMEKVSGLPASSLFSGRSAALVDSHASAPRHPDGPDPRTGDSKRHGLHGHHDHRHLLPEPGN